MFRSRLVLCVSRLVLCVLLLLVFPASALERPEITFKIFQFPPNMIPRINGNDDDWAMVPDSYAIGMDQLEDTEAPGGHGTNRDRKDLDVKVKVGWVKGLNRLYFLYEAYKGYWDFSRPDLHNDIFEVVVDGDLSGGPLIDMYHRDVWTPAAVGDMSKLDPRISSSDAYYAQQGAHAQNYHIFTPAEGKDWAMDWGCAQYTKELPYANHAINYNFKPGQSGKLILEFWITPFDYAGCEGPERAVESVLTENKLIGLSWAVIDYNDPTSNKRKFWNLSHKQTFFGNASDLVAFRLSPSSASRSMRSGRSRWLTRKRGLSPSRTNRRGRSLPGSGTSVTEPPRANRTRSISTGTGRAERAITPRS